MNYERGLLNKMHFFRKYKTPLITLTIFTCIGLIVWIFLDIRYFVLFVCIGLSDSGTRIIIEKYPKLLQLSRRCLQLGIAGFLFGWLSLYIGVNFQFPEIFFDIYTGIVSGALIQLLVARIILPFFFGNAFCSRACWTGAFFELTNSKTSCKRTPKKRSNFIAWGYLIFIVVFSLFFAFFRNPAVNLELRRGWIIGEFLFIITSGLILALIWGSRAYCRMLCPFLTISGLISPYSIFKITPVKAEECSSCNLCNQACPMLIDVMSCVHNNQRINNRTCILCERCVSSCPNDVLKIADKIPRNNQIEK